MSIIQIIVVIGLVAFVIFGLLLQFHIRQFQDGGTKEHFDQLHEWIKDNPERAEELGYTRKERIEDH